MRSRIASVGSSETHTTRVTQLDSASLVMGLHLKHSNSIVQLLRHWEGLTLCFEAGKTDTYHCSPD
jgi:hypothetical protein